MAKRLKTIVALFLFFAVFPATVLASDPFPVSAYFFYGEGCPHCHQERQFLSGLEARYPSLEIYEFEIYKNGGNLEILKKTAKALNADNGMVPFLVVNDSYFIGYIEGSISEGIERRVKECSLQSCADSIAAIAGIKSLKGQEQGSEPFQQSEKNEETGNIVGLAGPEDGLGAEDFSETAGSREIKIKVPFYGELDAASFSLPVITAIMGILDGFNPCAMWALLFLISLLLEVRDKKRMWIFGGAFVFSSALVYFFFMAAWLNLILFLGFIIWIRLAIGGLALAGGAYSIREFIWNKSGGCKVAGDEKRRNVFEKIKNAVRMQSFWLALGGVVVLAVAINMVELICSAGLPAVYAQILAINSVSEAQRYAYLSLYVFFFMIDDLFVFFAAMITMELTGITTKYARFSRLIGGLVLLCIGILLILKPEWLMFG
ncbi:MAG: hypothetical protein WC397_03875 [Candidatus Paceibacterota bacterium]|jgi:hypothetical protein